MADDLVLNPKCAVISAITVALYWVCPTRYDRTMRWMVTGALAVGTYSAVAWYDQIYECKRNRLKARGGLYSATLGQLKPSVDPLLGTYGVQLPAETVLAAAADTVLA